jgi:hypothetical protein
MATNVENRAIVEQWFTAVWGNPCDLSVIDKLTTSEVLLQYAEDGCHRGPAAVKWFLIKLREAFPDFNLKITGEPTSERDFVVVRWEGRGTHTGSAYDDFCIGPLPAASGQVICIAGHSAVRLERGKIAEEAAWSRPRRDVVAAILATTWE